MKKWKKNLFTILVVVLLFTIGILFIVLDPKVIMSILRFIIVIILLASSIRFLIIVKDYRGKDKTMLIMQSVILLVFAIAILFVPITFLMQIIGVIILLQAILRLIIAPIKMIQFKQDIPMYIIGILLLVAVESILKVVMIILGVGLILLGIYLLILVHTFRKKDQNVMVYVFEKYIQSEAKKNSWE